MNVLVRMIAGAQRVLQPHIRRVETEKTFASWWSIQTRA